MKVLNLVLFASLMIASPSYASFLEHCEFSGEILSVDSISQLGVNTTSGNYKFAMVVRISSVNVGTNSDIGCQAQVGNLKVFQIDRNEVETYNSMKTVKLSYTFISSLIPTGSISSETWDLIDEAPLFDGGALVDQAFFDANTQEIVVNVKHGGGCGVHKYSLEMGACRETFPVQCEAELIHKTDDICEALLYREARFSLSQYGLDDGYFKGASLLIKGAGGSEVAVKLP